MKPYRFHPAALAEYDEAASWYATRASVAPAFVEAVERAVLDIRQAPEAWPRVVDDVRRFVLERFPYSVVYVSEADGVLIVAVAHASRRPGYWLTRLSR